MENKEKRKEKEKYNNNRIIWITQLYSKEQIFNEKKRNYRNYFIAIDMKDNIIIFFLIL